MLPNSFNSIDYYGLGEDETYPDRKKCAFTGWYKQTPFVTPYIRPQECGNHEECRKIIINGKSSKLNILYIDEYYKFKFLPYTEFEIENSNHLHEFPFSDYNYLTISGFTRGVGGDDSWGAPVYKKYTIDGKKKLSFKFIISPIK